MHIHIQYHDNYDYYDIIRINEITVDVTMIYTISINNFELAILLLVHIRG